MSWPLASCKRKLRHISTMPSSLLLQVLENSDPAANLSHSRGRLECSSIDRLGIDQAATHRLRSGSGELYSPDKPASSCGTSKDDFMLPRSSVAICKMK